MKASFLIAEEVRPEASGKMTLLGLFPGDTIILHKGERPEGVPENAPAGLEKLTIMATISDTEGTYKVKGKIVDPSGKFKELELGEATIQKGFSHSAIIELKPFLIKQPGIFHFEYIVGKKKFDFPFEVREQSTEAIRE